MKHTSASGAHLSGLSCKQTLQSVAAAITVHFTVARSDAAPRAQFITV